MHTHVNRNNWRWNLKVSAFSRYSFSFYYWLIRFWVLLFALGLHICNCHLSDAAVPGWSDISSSSFLGWWSSLPGGQNRHKQRAPSDVAVTIAGLLWSPWYGCDCNSILHLHCNFCIIYSARNDTNFPAPQPSCGPNQLLNAFLAHTNIFSGGR